MADEQLTLEHRFSHANEDTVGAPYAKGSDTSKAAAERVATKVERNRLEILSLLLGAGSHGAIWDEMWERLHLSPTSNGRVTELRDDDLIRDSGLRRRTRTGSPAVVWVITAKGAQILAAHTEAKTA